MFVAGEGHHVGITFNIRVKRMARRREGNEGKYTRGGSVTVKRASIGGISLCDVSITCLLARKSMNHLG